MNNEYKYDSKIYRVVRQQEVLIPFSGNQPSQELFSSIDKEEAMQKCEYYKEITPEDFYPQNSMLGKTTIKIVEDDPLGLLSIVFRPKLDKET